MGTLIPSPKLIICDFDNTLVESETVNADIFVDYFGREYAIVPDEEDRAIVDSAAFIEVLQHFLDKYPKELADASEAKMATGFLDFKDKRLRDLDIPVATGLNTLFDLHLPLAIVSGSYTREIEDVARAAAIPLHRFDPVLGSDQYQPWKPDPTGLLRAAAQHGIAPCETWVLEDSVRGLQAARSAQMHAVYIGEFSFLRAEAARRWADALFATISDCTTEIVAQLR